MLILTRKKDESLVLDNQIVIKIIEINESSVRLGIEAPKHIEIHRKEIYDKIQEENKSAISEQSKVEALGKLLKKDKE